MEKRQIALQMVSNGMGISEVFDFVYAERGCSRRASRRDCHWALEELQLALDTHDLAHLNSHMATTLQRMGRKQRCLVNMRAPLVHSFCCTTYRCLAGWTLMRRKLSATVGVIAAATPGPDSD